MPRRPPKVAAAKHLVATGFASDLDHARALIMTGRVIGKDEQGREFKVQKPGDLVSSQCSFRTSGASASERRFVSRGGLKLEHALEVFAVAVEGRVAIDVGIGSGGFTDCLLKRRARLVYGVDVGYGQVDWSLRNDPRVILFERTHIRDLDPSAFRDPPTLAVIDTSFISLTSVLPVLIEKAAKLEAIVALIKPQFECRPEHLDRGIVVSDAAREEARDRVLAFAAEQGLKPMGCCESPIRGADGNIEYLAHLEGPQGGT